MKKIVKFLSLILVVIFTFSAVSCKNSQTNNNQSNTATAFNAVNENHNAVIKERDYYLIDNGNTEWTIVIPENALSYELLAVELINEYFDLALNTTFAVTTDKNLSGNGKYISIGDTSLMRNSGISIAESKFGTSGYRIITKDDVIFISGSRSAERRGTYYGAQDFLFRTINWRAYTNTEILYDIKTNLKMMDFNVVEIADFDKRNVGYDLTYSDSNYRNLMRLYGNTRTTDYSIKYYAHSHFEVLPPEIYCKEHPEWYYYKDGFGGYSTENHKDFYRFAQLCVTNEEMTQAFIDEITYQFVANPKATFVHLGIQDSTLYCKCDNCSKWIADRNTTYGGLSVNFTNKVARAVTENIKKIDPTRKLKFQMFAYFATIAPPAKLVNGEWVADCAEVIPDENVYIQFTPLHANGYETIDNVEKNKVRYEYFMGWSGITDRISVWHYCINFEHYLISHKNWDITAEDYRFYYEHGVNDMYDQGPLTDSVLQMKEMRVWILSKLMWNVNLSWQALAEEFISVYYGKAGEKILEAYNMMTTYNEKLRVVDDAFREGKVQVVDTELEELWPFSYVEGQRMIFNEAFETLNKITDVEEYEKYYWRVATVYFENIYLQMQFHMEKYPKDYITEQIDLFEKIAKKYNYLNTSEGTRSIQTNYIDKWRGDKA